MTLLTNENQPLPPMVSDFWNQPGVIARNDFKFKSLSSFNFNTAVGCCHGCLFCYVPSTSANKQAASLGKLGVDDPDAEWGNYVFVRQWDEARFLKSLATAEATPADKLKIDGHRAVMFSSTTDPYQVIRSEQPRVGRELRRAHRQMVRRALELIRDQSTLNVRILTRSPLARIDFDVMKSFGERLVFGMSLPTLDDKLARVYEVHSPSPTQRLQTLRAAKAAGLHVYVAVAPTYPECDEADLRATLLAVKELDPITVFHEPINIRAENAERIRLYAESIGVTVDTSVYASPEAWRPYAINQLQMVERLAGEVGLADRLHLWPDASLDTNTALSTYANPLEMHRWIRRWHQRISEWPQAIVA